MHGFKATIRSESGMGTEIEGKETSQRANVQVEGKSVEHDREGRTRERERGEMRDAEIIPVAREPKKKEVTKEREEGIMSGRVVYGVARWACH